MKCYDYTTRKIGDYAELQGGGVQTEWVSIWSVHSAVFALFLNYRVWSWSHTKISHQTIFCNLFLWMDANILVSLANLNLINEVAISSNICCRLLTVIISYSCQAFCIVRWNYWPRTGDESAAFDRKTCWYSWGRRYEVGKKCQGILDFWRIPAFTTEALWWCSSLLNCRSHGELDSSCI